MAESRDTLLLLPLFTLQRDPHIGCLHPGNGSRQVSPCTSCFSLYQQLLAEVSWDTGNTSSLWIRGEKIKKPVFLSCQVYLSI